MHTIRNMTKPVANLVSLLFLAMSIFVPAAQAGMVSTDAVIQHEQHQWDKQTINSMLKKDEVVAQLQHLGVDAQDVQARVDALTDEELQQLSANLNEMPAGGDILGTAFLVFLVLVITDLLGASDIFPFIKPIR